MLFANYISEGLCPLMKTNSLWSKRQVRCYYLLANNVATGRIYKILSSTLKVHIIYIGKYGILKIYY